MKAPAINNVIYQTKAIKPGTPRSVIDRVMTDLIGCLEYLSEELKIQLEQKQRSRCRPSSLRSLLIEVTGGIDVGASDLQIVCYPPKFLCF